MPLTSTPDPNPQVEFVRLYRASLIPLRVIAPCLVWVLHDYFVTVEDEIRYVWSQRAGLGKYMFFFIRYYTILLLVFDVAQIHSFAIKGVPNESLCVAFDPTICIVGAISLWSVEIMMQIRIFALYGRSKKVAVFNGCFFMLTIIAFSWLIVHNIRRRPAQIASAMKFPIPGCPTVHGGLQWTLWFPATVFEVNLFGFALFKSVRSLSFRRKLNKRLPLIHLLLQDNIMYFFGITCVLILNNLMTLPSSGIPWFSFGPFHAAIGIMTSRMYIHLRKFSVKVTNAELSTIKISAFAPAPGVPNPSIDSDNDYDDQSDDDDGVGSMFSDETEPESIVGEASIRRISGDVESQRETGPPGLGRLSFNVHTQGDALTRGHRRGVGSSSSSMTSHSPSHLQPHPHSHDPQTVDISSTPHIPPGALLQS